MLLSKKFILPVLLLILLLSLSSPFVSYAQTTGAEVGVFESLQAAPGATIQVPVSVRNVADLYGLDFTLEFDPEIVQVQDANPASAGVQASLGTFLEPGLLLFNTVDNEQGTIRFAMSQVNPAEAKSGQGIILVITFSAVKEGQSPLEITAATLGTREGVEIPSQAVNATITVSAGAPAQAATYPVADTGSVIIVNTLTPTAIPSPTEIPTPTETPAPTLAAAVSPTIPSAAEPATEAAQLDSSQRAGETPAAETNQAGYFLVKNWWIVLLLLAAVAGAGIYYLKMKQPSTPREEKSDDESK